MPPSRLYFISHPVENVPIYCAIFMVAAYFPLSIILGRILKKKAFEAKKAAAFNLVFNLIFVILFFGVLEYSAAYTEKNLNKKALEKQSLLVSDDLYFWDVAKGAKNQGVNGNWTFSTDSRGIRSDFEIPLKKEKGEFRILVIGDSWAFGHGVNNDETFCSRLESMMSREYPDRKIRVINAGRPAWCVAQGVIYFKMSGIRYDPDLVIVKNFLNGDTLSIFSRLYPLPSSEGSKKMKTLMWKSRFYLYLRWMIFKNEDKKRRAAGGEARYRADGYDEIEYKKKLYGDLDDFCRSRKIPVIYANVFFNYGIFRLNPIKEFAEKRGVDYLEIRTDFMDDPRHLDFDPHHPGKNGHLRIARRLFEHIKSGALVK